MTLVHKEPQALETHYYTFSQRETKQTAISFVCLDRQSRKKTFVGKVGIINHNWLDTK